MVEINHFTETEVTELQRYLEKHSPHTLLTQTYVLSENPIDKSIVFITIYRILLSCKNYASTKELKEKMNGLLDESKEVYEEMYPLVLQYNNLSINYGKSDLKQKIIEILCVIEKNKRINKIIDAYLVFGEKIELNRTEDYMGVDLENDYGKEAMKEIRKIIENEKI